MKYNYKADLITIGQWLESNVCFGVFNEPYTSNRTYQEIGERFVRYIKKVEDGFVVPPEEKLNDNEIHAVMKYLVAYRLTPHAIAFAYQNKDEFPFQDRYVMERNCVSKSVMYLSDRALCKFHIIMQPPSNFKNVSMHIRDYFEIFEKEKFAVELDGLESLEFGAGRDIVKNALSVMEDVPVLLQAGFLHYGDYECYSGLYHIEKLVKFYESLGFENVNHHYGCYEESVVMMAHKEKLQELEENIREFDENEERTEK